MMTIAQFRTQDVGSVARGALLRCTQQVEVFADKGSVAKWLHVVPFGPVVSAVDGRTFQISDINRLAAASHTPMLLDWEHNSEKYDGSTRAAGWLLELAVEDGTKGRFPRPGIWARADFTAEGAKDVDGKFYRYLSPVLLLAGEERDAVEMMSVALTNRPALRMAEIGAFRARFTAESEASPLSKSVRARLKAWGASDEQISAAESFHAERADRARAAHADGAKDPEFARAEYADARTLVTDNTNRRRAALSDSLDGHKDSMGRSFSDPVYDEARAFVATRRKQAAR